MFPLLPKGDQTKWLKYFWLKIFSICHRCLWHRWQTLSCEYLRKFSKKFETVFSEYSGAGGKLIDEKNQKQKISWHCPFKVENSEFASHLSFNGFFLENSIKTFSTVPKPASNSAFLDHISIFLHIWSIARREWLRKSKESKAQDYVQYIYCI